PSDITPSWMRAPPESLRPTIGAPIFIARSMIFTILAALVSESDPPKTEVLGEGVDGAAVDAAGPGDHAVARHQLLLHAEVTAEMRDQLVGLVEGAGIDEELAP